ncbi:MAG: hypothetical protein K6U87_07145 [Firmicutes bacterium]|nr:hypothetical protein [Bacillota bacterium]
MAAWVGGTAGWGLAAVQLFPPSWPEAWGAVGIMEVLAWSFVTRMRWRWPALLCAGLAVLRAVVLAGARGGWWGIPAVALADWAEGLALYMAVTLAWQARAWTLSAWSVATATAGLVGGRWASWVMTSWWAALGTWLWVAPRPAGREAWVGAEQRQ